MVNSDFILCNGGCKVEIEFNYLSFDFNVNFNNISISSDLVFEGELSNGSLDLEFPFNSNDINVSA
jgi:hypothetical protein